MPKLTVFFRYKVIDSYLFDNGVVRIGNDEGNDLRIDSLAIAPQHAVIEYKDGVNVINQLNDEFPVLVNGKKSNKAELKDNDMITLGKHDLLFHSTETLGSSLPESATSPVSPIIVKTFNETVHDAPLPNAGLQVMNGQNIGKLLPLKKAMTRIGNSGSGVVVIAKRKDGYFISTLENSENISVNKQPINNEFLKLSHNDVVVINDTALQFFLG